MVLCLILFGSHAETEGQGVVNLESEHRRAVELARADGHDEALIILNNLAKQYPNYYPVERDVIIILTWKGDCRAALRRYEHVRQRPDLEKYLILAVAECQAELGRIQEETDLLSRGRERWPKDTSLVNAHNVAEKKLTSRRLHELEISGDTDESDQGNREWSLFAKLSRALADRTRIYARYLLLRSQDPEFDTGDLNRIGAGIQHEFRNGIIIDQEISSDTRRSHEGGARTAVAFLPNDLWRFDAEYTNFAEDLPLRARAQGIEADRASASVDFHTADYRWSWAASGTHYDFTDTNERGALYTVLAYAYQLEALRERRLILELYGSNNTLADTVYYNPSSDQEITITHKTDFVFPTSFLRHVDHLYLSIGRYDQEGFDSHGTWGVRYEQNYDFDDDTSLGLGIGYARRIYDGQREYQTTVNAFFIKRF